MQRAEILQQAGKTLIITLRLRVSLQTALGLLASAGLQMPRSWVTVILPKEVRGTINKNYSPTLCIATVATHKGETDEDMNELI